MAHSARRDGDAHRLVATKLLDVENYASSTARTIPSGCMGWAHCSASPHDAASKRSVLWLRLSVLINSFADDLIKGGSIASDFTCGSKHIAPTLNWSGTPKNSGVGHPLLQPDGTECPRCQSFALVVEDMDYPHGVGQGINSVKTHFWAVNIPGDWSNFNDEMASKTYKDLPMAVVGKNDFDDIGLTPMCPSQGVHRYRTTLWALRGYLGSEQDPISPDTPYSQILPQLEQLELARSSFYGNVKGKPKVGFLSVKESLWRLVTTNECQKRILAFGDSNTKILKIYVILRRHVDHFSFYIVGDIRDTSLCHYVFLVFPVFDSSWLAWSQTDVFSSKSQRNFLFKLPPVLFNVLFIFMCGFFCFNIFSKKILLGTIFFSTYFFIFWSCVF